MWKKAPPVALSGGVAGQSLASFPQQALCRKEVLKAHEMLHAAALRKHSRRNFDIVFDKCFADELRRLRELVDQGLVVIEPNTIRLTVPLGRLLVRAVAAVFDHYLPSTAYRDGLATHLSSKVG